MAYAAPQPYGRPAQQQYVQYGQRPVHYAQPQVAAVQQYQPVHQHQPVLQHQHQPGRVPGQLAQLAQPSQPAQPARPAQPAQPVHSVGKPQAILWRPARRTAGPGGVLVHSPNLYWAPQSRCPVGEGVVAFSTEDKLEFAYDAFNVGRDFGPLDIARTVMYCRWVDSLCQAHAGCSALVHITSDTCAEHRANTVALCGAYMVLALGYSAEDAFRPFANEPLTPFLDCRGESASGSAIGAEDEAEFELSVLDILRGLAHARSLGWLDYRTFGVEDHASMLRPEHGDMSWLLPGKALALASPWAEDKDQDGLPVCTPQLLAPYFQRHGVGMVIQCNHPEREEEGPRQRLLCYEAQAFEDLGIRHVHIPFEDGGCPSIDIVLKFLELTQAPACNYAVHCRSGLGRTATLIGAYAMQHFGFTARSFIGWARVMRPGTVHGCQQQYLCNLERCIKPGQKGVAQIGSLGVLYGMDQRERLQLLPRRELRFWALDSGIPAAQTRHQSNADIIRQIMAVHGVHAPAASQPATAVQQAQAAPSAALRAVDPGIAHRAAVQQAAAAQAAAAPAAAAPGWTFDGCGVPSTAAAAPATLLAAPNTPPSKPSAPAALSYSGTSTAASSTAPSTLSGVPAAAEPPRLQGVGAVQRSATQPVAAVTQMAAASTAPAAAAAAPVSPVVTSASSGSKGGAAEAPRAAEAEPKPGLSAAIASLSRGLAASEAGTPSRAAAGGASGLSLGSGPSPAARVDEWDEVLRYLRLLMAVQADGVPSWEKVRGLIEQLRDLYRARGGAGASAERRGSDSQRAADAGGGSEVENTLTQVRAARQAAAREAEAREAELREVQQQARDTQRQCEQLKFRLSLERETRSAESKRAPAWMDGAGGARTALSRLQLRSATGGTGPDAARQEKPPQEEPPWDDARRSIEKLRDQFQLAVKQARVSIAAS